MGRLYNYCYRSDLTVFSAITGAFIDALSTALEDKRLTFEDILNGEESYSETLMYKVQKLLGPIESPVQAPIQTYHFMNSAEVQEFLSEEKEFKFVDTQVKYDQQYSYIVTAYQMVIGARYFLR